MTLRLVVDGDPAQTRRIRAWRAANPGYVFTRDRWFWRVSDGHREVAGRTWTDVLRGLDDAIAGRHPWIPCEAPEAPGQRRVSRPPDIA